ncbi:GNAT family N-acetyltransferase [Speluncibacter jeojiensis]|uniref:GNAT family N-acetyltransferase n=1 Tax=Speluncibacter jeojiensis TaxID=2710754 RepID=A0A9X4RFN5_9ACTN|nr:GNAT family N-acetyltransferase [Corynebacteriales bacterium D3-21]
MTTEAIEHARTDDDVRACFLLFRELRPFLDEETFLSRWRRQREERYELVYVRDGDGQIVAAAGFREMTTMAWGHVLYLDDLIALPSHRGRGLGSLLLRFLQDETVRRGCDQLHLDTGYTRHAAHRSYLRNGFDIVCHHMAWEPPADSRG